MTRTIIASAALFAASALAGNAVVVNSCAYDVHLSNTPSADGGYTAINQILSSGGSYEQAWTELSNGNGWSIKLSQSDDMGSNILQYEYTYHDDGTIWYDLSAVNGNPWDSDYEITATSGCTPRQAAYRYSTDDAFGMQDCPDSATITVTLCTGKSAGGSTTSPAASPSETTTTAAAPTSPTTSATTTYTHGQNTWTFNNKGLETPVKKKHTPTTLATVTESDSYDGAAVTVTNVHMKTVTSYVTATAAPEKRHEHHPRHPHQRR